MHFIDSFYLRFRLFKFILNIPQINLQLTLASSQMDGQDIVFLMFLRHLVVATALFVQHLLLLFLVQTREVNSAVKQTV